MPPFSFALCKRDKVDGEHDEMCSVKQTKTKIFEHRTHIAWLRNGCVLGYTRHIQHILTIHSLTHSVAQSVACRRRAHTTEEKKKKKKHTHFIHHRRTRADVHANKYVHIFKETKAEHREQLHSLPYCIKGFFSD